MGSLFRFARNLKGVLMVTSIFIIIGLVGFLLLSVRAFARLSKLSQHSRFDLYPVPKEGREKAKYGGSYFEETEWWTKPRKLDRTAENIDIFKEMFLIKKLFVNQRTLWWSSFMFHWGIYFMFGWSVLLLINGFYGAVWFTVFTQIVGVIGFTLATVGAVLLLGRRIFDESYRVYTTPSEYFNLILILTVLITGIICWTSVMSPVTVANDVFTLKAVQYPTLVVVHLVLLGCMMLYIPLSKMGHYAAKFFSFRSVQWDNDPNLPGSKVEKDVAASAANPPKTHWDAPHTRPAASTESED